VLIARLKSHVNIGNLIFAVSLVFVVWLVWYFYTRRLAAARRAPDPGGAGPADPVHASRAPVQGCRRRPTSPSSCSTWRSAPMPSVLPTEYDRIAIYSQARTRSTISSSAARVPAGDGADAPAHPVLFWVNVVMVVYTLYGYVFPRSLDFFWHPGTTFIAWSRPPRWSFPPASTASTASSRSR
jgi:hypothetical protein